MLDRIIAISSDEHALLLLIAALNLATALVSQRSVKRVHAEMRRLRDGR